MDLPDHDHCRHCGDPVPFEQAYCCEECYYADRAEKAKARRKEVLMAALAVGGAAAILIIGYLVRRPRRVVPVANLY